MAHCLRPLSRIHAPRTRGERARQRSNSSSSQTSVEDSRPTDTEAVCSGDAAIVLSQTSVEDSRPTDKRDGELGLNPDEGRLRPLSRIHAPRTIWVDGQLIAEQNCLRPLSRIHAPRTREYRQKLVGIRNVSDLCRGFTPHGHLLFSIGLYPFLGVSDLCRGFTPHGPASATRVRDSMKRSQTSVEDSRPTDTGEVAVLAGVGSGLRPLSRIHAPRTG